MLFAIYGVTVLLSLLFALYGLYEVIHGVFTEYADEVCFSATHPQMNGKVNWLKFIVAELRLILLCAIPIVNLLISYNMTSEDVIDTAVEQLSDWFANNFNAKLDECGLWDEWLDNN